jgi:hypothetical protein
MEAAIKLDVCDDCGYPFDMWAVKRYPLPAPRIVQGRATVPAARYEYWNLCPPCADERGY